MDDETAFNIDPGAGLEGRSPQESGATAYTAAEAVPTTFDLRDAASYRPMRLLARLQQQKPQSVALHVVYNSEGSGFDHEGIANFPLLGGAGAIGTVLIVDYGDLTGKHRFCADLKSGTYLLPGVTFVQVYALAWAQSGTLGFPAQFAAALSRAVPSNPKPFTYTGAGDIEAGGSRLVVLPWYAGAADIWANGWVGGIGAANAPNLRAPEIGLYRDYTTGLFVPPWGPVSLSGDSLDTDAFNLENAGPAEVRCFAQFLLEL